MTEVKFCKHNLSADGEQVVLQLKEELEQTTIEIALRVENCGVCGGGPFALINEQVVQGETITGLVDKIKKMV